LYPEKQVLVVKDLALPIYSLSKAILPHTNNIDKQMMSALYRQTVSTVKFCLQPMPVIDYAYFRFEHIKFACSLPKVV